MEKMPSLLNVERYLIDGTANVYFNHGQLFDFENRLIASLDFKHALSVLKYRDGVLVCNARNGEAFLISEGKVESIGLSINDKQGLYLFYYIGSSSETGIIDVTGKQIFKSTMASGLYFVSENGTIYDHAPSFVRRFSSSTSVEWEHKLGNVIKNEKGNEIIKFLGACRGRVFVLSSGGHVFVLDDTTGELIKIIYSVDKMNMRDSFMHSEDHHIYCFSHQFVKINTETLEIETSIEMASWKKEPETVTLMYGINSSSLQGRYISFTSFTSRSAGASKWIGLFDYKKNEIVFHHELLKERDNIFIPPAEYPVLSNGKLYVLDSTNTLHILNDGLFKS